MMHCLHQYFKLFRYCTLLENFLPIEKGEGLVTVLDKQTKRFSRNETNKRTSLLLSVPADVQGSVNVQFRRQQHQRSTEMDRNPFRVGNCLWV